MPDDFDDIIRDIVEAVPPTDLTGREGLRGFPVEAIWREGVYTAIRLAVDDPEISASYTTPGQYVAMQLGGSRPRFMAIANSPDRARRDGWEFLIDPTSRLEPVVEAMELGDEVILGEAEGPGYPLSVRHIEQALIFVTGPGIASVRPVIQYWVDHPEAAPPHVVLYYGESEPDDHAYVEDLARWATDHGVVIERVAEADADELRYVQDVFRARPRTLEGTMVLLCGAAVMMQIVARMLLEAGFPARHIYTNIA